MDITEKEMQFIMLLFKNPEKDYNAHIIARELCMSAMGALKIARRLEKEKIIIAKQLGKAIFYTLTLSKEYTQQYLCFVLKREAEQSPPYIKRWVAEIQKAQHATSAILFGSVLHKFKEAKDIDILFITDNKNFAALKKEIYAINLINQKKIHPVYQSKEDFVNNLRKNDKIILNALKGILVLGEKDIVEMVKACH